MIKKKIELLPHQWEFMTSKDKFVGLIAGIGSGKSFVGSAYILSRVIQFPHALHFIGANTYGQLRDSTLRAMFNLLDDKEILYEYNQSSGLLEFCGGQVLCKSMENYDALRGFEIASFWIDEARDLKLEAFQVMMGRLRDKKADSLQGRITTSPSGFNWIYDFFHVHGEHHTNDFKIISGSSYLNTYLPDGYVDTLKANYSEEFYKQEILGEFVNIYQGQAYTQFSFSNIVESNPFSEYAVHPMLPVAIGLDFNVGHMAWCFAQKRVDEVYFFDELFVRGTNTQECAPVLVQKLLDIHPQIKKVGVILAGDASGKANKTSSAGQTDYDIICMALDEACIPWHNQTPESNPLVKDRVNTMNAKFKNSAGKSSISVHKRCTNLIKDFERVSWKQGANGALLDQTTDPSLSHMSDAAGYVVCALAPIGYSNGSASIRVIRR